MNASCGRVIRECCRVFGLDSPRHVSAVGLSFLRAARLEAFCITRGFRCVGRT